LVAFSLAASGVAVALSAPHRWREVVAAAALGAIAHGGGASAPATRARRRSVREGHRDAAAQCAFEPERDAAEAEAVHELRVLFAADGAVLPPRYGDGEIASFLQAAKPRLSVAAACQAIEEDIRWRAARAARAPGAAAAAAAPAAAAASAAGPAAAAVWSGGADGDGRDRLGRPVLLLRVQQLLAAAPEPDADANGADALADAVVDALDAIADAHGARPLAVVLDMRGVEIARGHASLGRARDLVAVLRAHYPQRAGAIHVVHLLPVMRWVVAAACALIDSRSAKKVVVHAHAAAGLRDHFEAGALPPEYLGAAADAPTDAPPDGAADGNGVADGAADGAVPRTRTAAELQADLLAASEEQLRGRGRPKPVSRQGSRS